MRPWITAAVGVIAALLAGGEAWREGAISWSLAAVWIAYAPFLAWITMAKLWDEVPVDDDSYDKFKSWLLALTWLLGGVSGLLHGLVAAAPASALIATVGALVGFVLVVAERRNARRQR